MRAFLTIDPDNKEEHFDVERATVQKRDTRSDPAIKFAANIAANSLKEGNEGRYNYLGNEFRKKNKGLPSLNQVFNGITEEQKR